MYRVHTVLVWQHLMRNALDACVGVEAAQVELTAALEEGGLIVVSVSDNGCGISADNLDNIFVPFFTTKRNGSGVGMSMVKQIIRANHGRIGVSSTPGIGTTISISFRQY